MAKQKKGFTRKHVFIDRSIQGKYMLTFLIPMLILLLFLMITLYFASETIISTTARIARSDMDNITASYMQDRHDPTVQEYRALNRRLNEYIRDLSTSDNIRSEIFKTLLIVFGIGLFIVIIQIVLLTIFFSHKLAGPVYRFEKACKEMIGGCYTDQIYLRKGDQMQNLAKLLNEVMKVTRQRMEVLYSGDQKEKEELNSTLKL